MNETTQQTGLAVQTAPTAIVAFGPPADVDLADFAEALENITLRVPKIKNLGSGSVFFTILDPETDEPTPAKSIKGVILHSYKSRSYYATAYSNSTETTPPDCSCYNVKDGIGRVQLFTVRRL